MVVDVGEVGLKSAGGVFDPILDFANDEAAELWVLEDITDGE